MFSFHFLLLVCPSMHLCTSPKCSFWNKWWFYNRWFLNFSYLYCVWEDHSRVHTILPLFLLYCFKILFVARGIIGLKYVIRRYGGGMSSAKAALESDTRVSCSIFSAWRKKKRRGETIWFSPLEYLISTQILLHFIIERSHANDVGACFRGRKKKES